MVLSPDFDLYQLLPPVSPLRLYFLCFLRDYCVRKIEAVGAPWKAMKKRNWFMFWDVSKQLKWVLSLAIEPSKRWIISDCHSVGEDSDSVYFMYWACSKAFLAYSFYKLLFDCDSSSKAFFFLLRPLNTILFIIWNWGISIKLTVD